MSQDVQGRLRVHLQTGGASAAHLFLDTNTIQGGALSRLADQVGAINLRRTDSDLPKIRLLISALVFAERNAQERRERTEKGQSFDEGRVRAFLQSKQVAVVPFDIEAADGVSKVLAGWAEGKDELRRRRWKQICRTFHGAAQGEISADALRRLEGLEHPPRLSGTVDWLIAAQATAAGWWLVTDDKGMEFEQAPLLRSAELAAVLSAL